MSTYTLDEALVFSYELLAGPITPQFGTAAVAPAHFHAAQQHGQHGQHGQQLHQHGQQQADLDVDQYLSSPSELDEYASSSTGGSPGTVLGAPGSVGSAARAFSDDDAALNASADSLLAESASLEHYSAGGAAGTAQLYLGADADAMAYGAAAAGAHPAYAGHFEQGTLVPHGHSPGSTEKGDASDDSGDFDYDEPAPEPVLTSKPLFSSFKLNGTPAASGARGSKRKTSDHDSTVPTDPSTGERLVRHNKSEKKRRDNMNECITELHNLVPALHTIHKPSKGTILNKTLDYLKRLQHKSSRLETSLAQAHDELAKQRTFNQLLLQLLAEHGIVVPDALGMLPASGTASASPTDAPKAAGAANAAGYYMQDAGRVMIFVTALLFFAFAPWSNAALLNTQSGAAGARSLLSVPQMVYHLQGWYSVFFWIVMRWIVMSTLLVLALYWDTRYCNQAILKSLPTIRKLNREAEEYMSNGNYLEARMKTEEALVLLRRPVPRTTFDLFFGNLYQAARQIAHRCIMGLVLERFLIYTTGQMAYAAELQRSYLNMSQQNHCLPHYKKWSDLYIILCSINFSEILEGDTGQGLVQAYGTLCYHVIVHSRVFEVFASIYQALAFGVVKRLGLNKAQFGNFYIVIAYRNLMKGNFDKVFENLQKGIETHKMFKLEHHQRECVMMKGWIEHILGRPADSMQTFNSLYNWSHVDNDNYSKRWAMLGMIANFLHTGQNEKTSEWLHSESVLDEDLRMINNHQEIFALGFKALLHLRECFEDGALEVANKTLDRVQDTMQSGMPHNVMPLWKTIEVHMTLLEQYMQMGTEAAQSKAEQLRQLCKTDLEVFAQYIVVFPLMEIAYLVYYARFLFLTSGNEDKALDVLYRARDKAIANNISYMTALALFEIGRLLPADHPQRVKSLVDALTIFRDMEAAYEQQLTQAEQRTKFAPRLFRPQPLVLA